MRTHSSVVPVTTISMAVMPPTPLMVATEMTPSTEAPAPTHSSVDSVMITSMAVIHATSSKAEKASMPSTAVTMTTPSLAVKGLTT